MVNMIKEQINNLEEELDILLQDILKCHFEEITSLVDNLTGKMSKEMKKNEKWYKVEKLKQLIYKNISQEKEKWVEEIYRMEIQEDQSPNYTRDEIINLLQK